MKHINTLLITTILLLNAGTLSARDSNWDFILGGGICSENVYLGSNVYYVTPLPNFKASYSSGSFKYSLSILEGLGIDYTKPILGFYASLNFNVGETRNSKEYSVIGLPVKHDNKTEKLLEGTPDAETPLAYDFTIIYPSNLGLFGISYAYHPTKVQYNREDLKDETRAGCIYSLMYMIQTPATEHISISGLAALEFMDNNYADTWYSVDRETQSVNTFQAGAGLRSTMLAMQVNYKISETIDLSLIGSTKMLLGDAKDSPFTQEKFQGKMVMQTLYHF